MKEAIRHILNDGYRDENPRPKYKDGTPAHTLSVNHVMRTYNLSKGEFPICTLRPIAWKTAIKEILAIYQNQSNKISEFERCGCKWWKDWSLDDGTIGKAYPYNIESHRPNETKKMVIKIKRRIVPESEGEPRADDIPFFEKHDSIDGILYRDRYYVIGLDNEKTDNKHVYYKIQFISNNYVGSMRKDLLGYSNGVNPYDRTVFGIGYLGDYESVNNFTDEEVTILKKKWESMFFRCYTKNRKAVWHSYDNKFVHHKWHNFEAFLKDVRKLPQYFLAREERFKGWDIDKDYYGSNCYGPNTCVFLKHRENALYASTNSYYKIISENNEISYEINLTEFARKIYKQQKDAYKAVCEQKPIEGYRIDRVYQDDEYVYRYELSRNQVNELLLDIQNNPYGRRHIISFWNWSNIDKKALVECAYETIWNVRGRYLDMCMIQRSGDMLTASGPGGINEVQYAALQMMIARHCGYLPGVFTHFVANEQIYDRHMEAAKTLYSRAINPINLYEPYLVLKEGKTDFYDFTIEDFEMRNYYPIKPQLELELGI